MCWIGCLASKYFGWLIAAINTGLLVVYYFGLLFSCGSSCYDSNEPDRLPLETAIIGPAAVFLFGYIVALIALKRGTDQMRGCHCVIVAIWLLLLIGCCVLTAWNAYNMMHYKLGSSIIYHDAVYSVVLWNIMLMLISCNVMIRGEEDPLKRSPENGKNYRSIEEQAFDASNQNSIHEL